MSGGIFINFVNLKRGKYGQIAVFLLIVLVVLLIAAVALVNIGKIGVRRVRTANAADSAALAAASSLASVANNIVDSNEQLKIQYAAFVSALLVLSGSDCKRQICSPVFCPTQQQKDHGIYVFYTSWLILHYLFLMVSSKQGFDAARASGHQMAFGNVGIEEAQRRMRAQPEEIVQPRLSRWLNKEAVDDPSVSSPGDFEDESYTFKWFGYSIDTATGKEIRETEPNEVTSFVDIPECAFEFDPLPFMMTPKFYKFSYTGIDQVPTHKGCIYCACGASYTCLANDNAAFYNWIVAMNAQSKIDSAIFAGIIAAYNVAPLLYGCPATFDIESIIAALIALTMIPVIVPMPTAPPYVQCLGNCDCPAIHKAPVPAFVWVLYFTPLPWILDIKNDDITIRTRVTYREPRKETGFWTRKKTSVTSGASARMSGDFTPGGYEAELSGAE